jgi:hypothetical protein
MVKTLFSDKTHTVPQNSALTKKTPPTKKPFSTYGVSVPVTQSLVKKPPKK